MNPTVLMICSKCQAEWPDQAERCVVCGATRQFAETVHSQMQLTQPWERAEVQASALRKSGVADNPYLVLATIFFVTAAFGIPLIWMCPAWSHRTKWLLTWITIAYTIFILAIFAAVMLWVYRTIQQAL